MKKSSKNLILSITAIFSFFVAIGFTCFSIPETLAGLSDSTLAYVDSHPKNSGETPVESSDETLVEDSGETLAVVDSADSELTYTAPLGETLTTAPNYTSAYLIITTVEFVVLAILLLLSPIFVRVLLSKRAA